jgi:hypothetical protein
LVGPEQEAEEGKDPKMGLKGEKEEERDENIFMQKVVVG